MADVKITDLPAATLPLTGSEELPLVQGGTTSKATAQDIADLGGGGTLAGDVIGPAGSNTVATVGGKSAASVAGAVNAVGAATAAATASTLMARDGSGNVAANIFTGDLSGNAASATTASSAITAGTAVNFTGSLAGDVTGTQGATAIATFGASNRGLVPASGGGTVNFLRADGTWTTGAGGVTDVNGQTGSVSLTTDNIPEGTTNKYCTYANVNTAINAPASTYLFSNASQQVVGYNQYAIDDTTKFSNIQLTYQPNNLEVGPTSCNFNVNIDPLQNSPDDSLNVYSINCNLDASANGFSFGSNGQAVNLIQGGFNYGGNGSTYGGLSYINLNSSIGNGSDPVTIKSFSYFAGFLNINQFATIDGQLQGYGFQPNVIATATPTSNFSVNAFYDFAQMPVKVYGYNGVTINPTVNTIANNHDFIGFSTNPTISTMEGNAGVTGVGIYGTIGVLGTSGFQGVDIVGNLGTQAANSGISGVNFHPNITTMGANANVNGSNFNPNITTAHGFVGGYQAFPQIAGGDANVTLFNGGVSQVTTSGNCTLLNLNGLTADNKQSNWNIDNVRSNVGGVMVGVSGQGVQGQHVIFTQYITPDDTVITGTDMIVNILSPDVNMGNAGSSVTMGPSGLGYNMVGFAGQIHGAGHMDQLSALIAGGIFLENGTITEYRGVNNVMINAGFTGTVTNATAFYHEVGGAGLFATNHWGWKINSDIDNFCYRIAVNTTSKKVSNASVGFEIGGTDRALLLPSLADADEAALTALNGMLIYNSEMQKFRGYENGAWVNLV